MFIYVLFLAFQKRITWYFKW